MLLTQNDFYFKSLSLFTGIDCVYGLVLDSNQIVNIFEIFFVSDFLRIFFVSDFFILSFDLLTSFPNDLSNFQNVWPLLFLTSTKKVKNQSQSSLVFDLFCKGQERKRSNILKNK